jgi:hypothetical protein
MTRTARAFTCALLTLASSVPVTLHADTVQLTLRDGRLSLVATNATPGEIFEAWSRAGGVQIVNAERIQGPPVTLRLDNVSEEQALDTLLRPVTGYLARRRTDPAGPEGSVFDRIVIVATPVAARPTATAAAPASAPAPAAASARPAPAPVFPQPQVFPSGAQPPQGVPQGPGVTRLIGPDGQPVEDDQVGAPPPTQVPYVGGDSPDQRPPAPGPIRRTPPPPSQPPQPSQPQQPVPPSTSAPAGVPRPGMVVPSPTPAPVR